MSAIIIIRNGLFGASKRDGLMLKAYRKIAVKSSMTNLFHALEMLNVTCLMVPREAAKIAGLIAKIMRNHLYCRAPLTTPLETFDTS